MSVGAAETRNILEKAAESASLAYAERLVGSISRECLDHVMMLNESSLRRIYAFIFRLLPTFGHPFVPGQRFPRAKSDSIYRSRYSD